MLKHKMIADYEKLIYTDEMLRETWVRQIDHFVSLIDGGWTNSEVVDLIRFISGSKYGAILFPGSSVGRLLISKPQNGRLNYQQTLDVTVDIADKSIVMTYTNFDLIESLDDHRTSIEWQKTVENGNLLRSFLEFVEWNKLWFPSLQGKS